MTKGVRIPARLSAVNDRGGWLSLEITNRAVIEAVLSKIEVSSVRLPLAERHALPEGAVELMMDKKKQGGILSGSICINPRANEWWIEGMESKQGGCFFLSEVEKITQGVAG